MKKITYKTTLKQGDNVFQPRFKRDDENSIYWVDFTRNVLASHAGSYVWSVRWAKPIILGDHEDSYINECYEIVAQSHPILEEIPLITLKTYIAKLQANYAVKHGDLDAANHFYNGYKANPNQYTLADVEKAIELSRLQIMYNGKVELDSIIEKINSIEQIEVDEQFNIISIN